MPGARPGTVRFSHALLHDAAYSALPFRRRRELHCAAGEAIRERGGEELEEILAIHFGAARRWPETWRYGRLAGERALKRAAPREAAGFLASAVAAARWVKDVDPAELAAVTARLGEAAELAGSYDQARKAYAKARKLVAGDPVAEAELFLREGRLREGVGERLAGASLLHAAGSRRSGARRSPEADRGPRPARPRPRARPGCTAASTARRCRSWSRRSARPSGRATARRSPTPTTCSTGRTRDLGNPEAQRYRDLALPIFEDLGDFDKQGRVLTNLGVNAYHEGRWDEALELYERARQSHPSGPATRSAPRSTSTTSPRSGSSRGASTRPSGCCARCSRTWRASGFAFGIGDRPSQPGPDRDAPRRARARGRAAVTRARDAGHGRRSTAPVCELDAYEAKRLLLAGDPEGAKLLAERIQDGRPPDRRDPVAARVPRADHG